MLDRSFRVPHCSRIEREPMTDLTPEVHFSGIAKDYLSMAERWPLSWIRPREMRAVLELAGDVSGRHILELGCGAGYYTRQLLAAGAGHVTAVDISAAMVEALPAKKVTGIVGDAALIKITEKYCHILSTGMLEFVPDPAAAMSNARHHATDEGRMVVLMPELTWGGRCYRLYHRRHGLNIRLFSENEARTLFEASGWRIDAIRRVAPFTMVFALRAI
jgi:SAM-dependent methyltransferase